MVYRYRLGENAESEIRRLISKRMALSVQNIQDGSMDTDEVIHEFRKNMKKVRAALRLVRDVVGKERYHIENADARDIARAVFQLREMFVLKTTLEMLKEQFFDEINNDFYSETREKLKEKYGDLKKKLLDEENLLGQVVMRLDQKKEEVKSLPVPAEGFDAFRKGLERVYRRGRKAKKMAHRKAAPENYHEWRKRVKYLWYQLRLLKEIWPGGLKGYINELHVLSSDLGDIHDLFIFKKKIGKIIKASENEDKMNDLNVFTDELLKDKMNAALGLGDKIYCETSKDFMKRIEAYWDVAGNKN